jgi:hypothetical protein
VDLALVYGEVEAFEDIAANNVDVQILYFEHWHCRLPSQTECGHRPE